MSSKYTTLATVTAVATTELNALADDTAAVGAAYDNSVGWPLGRFEIILPTQGGARDGSAQVTLLLVPEGTAAAYGDVATLLTAAHTKAYKVTGDAVVLTLDAAATARTLVVDGVRVPHGNFKPGLLNESGQALAATGNIINMALYGMQDV